MSQIYFVGFIFISALAMLSLFVGAVTMAMSEALEQMAEEKELKMKAKKAAEKLKRLEDEGEPTRSERRCVRASLCSRSLH